MMSQLIGNMLSPSIRSVVKGMLARRGYELKARPRPLIERKDAELHVELGYLIPYCVERRPDFTFAQFGAYDGISSDPIRELVTRYHWRGVLVEPQRPMFERLKNNYCTESQLIFENVAVANRDEVRPFYTVRGGVPGVPPEIEQLASFNRDVILRHRGGVPNIKELIQIINVQCLTPISLLERSGLGKFDFVQIDTEGYDYEIIKLFDFQRINPLILNYEHAHLSPADSEACLRLLIGKGYRLHVGKFDTLAYRFN